MEIVDSLPTEERADFVADMLEEDYVRGAILDGKSSGADDYQSTIWKRHSRESRESWQIDPSDPNDPIYERTSGLAKWPTCSEAVSQSDKAALTANNSDSASPGPSPSCDAVDKSVSFGYDTYQLASSAKSSNESADTGVHVEDMSTISPDRFSPTDHDYDSPGYEDVMSPNTLSPGYATIDDDVDGPET